MARFDGSAALQLDFGTAPATPAPVARVGKALTLASSGGGADKYKALEHRRRQAQIKARRLLDILEEGE